MAGLSELPPWKYIEGSLLSPAAPILKFTGTTVANSGLVTLTALGEFTVIALTVDTCGNVIDSGFTVGFGESIPIVNFGASTDSDTVGGVSWILMLGAAAEAGSLGTAGSLTVMDTGVTSGKISSGAFNGSFTFGFISGFTTALGIVIAGVMLISSLNTDFGRTLAIICISTSGSWTCKSLVSP